MNQQMFKDRTKEFGLRVIRLVQALMELLVDAKVMPAKRLGALQQEANEILAMVVASIKTMRSRSLATARNRQS